MKTQMKLIPVLLLIGMLTVSCTNPFQRTETPTGGEKPNLTLTALFDTSMNIPPTVTPQVNPTSTVSLPTVAPSDAPTSTVAATATLEPTTAPTSVPASPTAVVYERVRTKMTAGYLDTAPVMDGTYEEWVDKTTKYKLPYVVWGPKNWKNQEDLEGAYAAAWDEDYLYVSVKVTDDIFVQRVSGAKLYLGDSVEILIDSNLSGDYYVQSLDGDDFQFGVSPGNPDKGIAKEVYLWYPSGKSGTKSQVLVGSLFETSPVYRVEVGIPWSMLGVTPKKGLRLGFAVSISDNDNTSSDVQQTMISTAQFRNFLNPTTWDELVLDK